MDKPKRDNFLSIALAMTISDDKNEVKYICLSDIQELAQKLTELSENYPFVDEYDMPDLSVNEVKKSKYVDYVSMNDEIAYHMSLEQSKEIIGRNLNLAQLICNYGNAKKFSDFVTKTTNNTVVFDCHNPNTTYEIVYIDNGQEKRENKIFTDGNIEVVEEYENYKKVKLDNATYCILGAYDHDVLIAGVFKTMIVMPGHLKLMEYEVSEFYNNHLATYESSEKPSVLRKRLN